MIVKKVLSNKINKFPKIILDTLAKSPIGERGGLLDLRYHQIITPWNWKDQSVLDLGAHNGRWSAAVIDQGARQVDCVDVRDELWKKTEQIKPNWMSKVKFHQADCAEWIRSNTGNWDTILCLGLLYHVSDPIKLLLDMVYQKPKKIIIDTYVTDGDEPKLIPYIESNLLGQGIVNTLSKQAIVCIPNLKAIEWLFEQVGWQLTEWKTPGIENRKDCKLYNTNQRITLSAELKTKNS